MSRENVEALQAVFEAGGAQDIEALMPFLPEDVVWYPPPHWIEKSEYWGHEGAREVLAIFTEHLDEYHVEVHELIDAGDRVVALMWQIGRPKGSSQELRQTVAGVYGDFREDGTIGKSWFFLTWDDALRAAGVSSAGT